MQMAWKSHNAIWKDSDQNKHVRYDFRFLKNMLMYFLKY